MPNNPHRSNLTARLADSQESHARKVLTARPLNVVRVQTSYVEDTQAAIDLLREHGKQFPADVPGMIVYRAGRRLERELTTYLTGER